MAGCFGIGRTPRRVAEVYHITPKLVGFSDFPLRHRRIDKNKRQHAANPPPGPAAHLHCKNKRHFTLVYRLDDYASFTG
jgi:hypothetical protein